MKRRASRPGFAFVVLATAWLGACGEGPLLPQDEAFARPNSLLYGPLFAKDTELPESGSCGLRDCTELEPWLSDAFLACHDAPGRYDTLSMIDCYGGEYRRQMAAVRTAEQRLLAQLPPAEAARLRIAQAEWRAAEDIEAQAGAGYDSAGSLFRILYVASTADYAVRRRIDLETRLGLGPSRPAS